MSTKIAVVTGAAGLVGSECVERLLEAIQLCEKISQRKLNWSYVEDNRIGRSYLVDKRCEEVPGSLSSVEVSLRCATNSKGNSPGECVSAVRKLC